MYITASYGTPGTATYSQSLGNIDNIMSTLPDNIINQITAKNVRDSIFTIYEIAQSELSPTLDVVATNGNITTLPITTNGLQINGTSSFNKNVIIYSTITDKTGATGTPGYVLSATNGGVVWSQNTSAVSLQTVVNVGNVSNKNIQINGLQNDGTASFSKNISLISTLSDKIGATGVPGYILSATNGGVVWIQNAPSFTYATPSFQQVTDTGNVSNRNIQISGLQIDGTASFLGTVSIKGKLIDNTSSSGTLGYVLSATSNGVIWVPQSSGTNNLYQTTVYGNTTSLPINIGGLIVNGTSSFNGTLTLTATVSINNGIIDNYGSTGGANQILTIDSTNKIKWQSVLPPILFNNITSDYTLSITDNQKLISASASSVINITVPTNASASFPVGSYVNILQYGSGGVTITGITGVSINSKSGYKSIGGQYVNVTLIQLAINNWLLSGDLIP